MSRRLIISLLTVVVGLGLICTPGFAKSKKEKKGKKVYYLSLGTSLAAGVQADPTTGESVVTDASYPGFIAEMLGHEIPRLRHVNLGCPAETSDTFIEGGICAYKRGSQLDEAAKFLRSHRKSTVLVTLDMGANDILRCIDGVNVNLACFTDVTRNLVANMIYIMKTLRRAAGWKVPIVAMNYYNPFAALWLQGPEMVMLAEQTNFLQGVINSALEGVYDGFHVPVADVADLFMSGDLVTDDIEIVGPSIPDSVEILCLYTWMCEWGNIHPNELGYGKIAEEFLNVVSLFERPRCD